MLPTRQGVGPSCVGLPAGRWATMTDFLCERFPAIARPTWLQRMSQGEVMDEFGAPVTPDRPYQAHIRVYYYRALAVEQPIPFHEVILYQDDRLIVVDKPHFLPVTPSGSYLHETVLVRLKRKLGLDDLAPIHRIDRDTAGLVLFSVRRQDRDAYQTLFRHRRVHKIYEAIAPCRPELHFPVTRESRIEEAGHFMLQHEIEGAPNAITHIRLLGRAEELARYELEPVTGKRHQLRVHMAALGIPIQWDGLYPTLTPEGADYGRPLQLLAKSISFDDPFSGRARHFESQQRLTLP